MQLTESPTTNRPELDYIFHPRSIAIAGASNSLFGGGSLLLMPLLSSGFKGNIYAVNPKETEVLGIKCYPSVRDIPEPVDYVISGIPARFTPQLVEDCATKGVRVLAFFTAGFTEKGEEDGKRLEAEIVDIARRGGVRLIGPNCMGIYCPASGLSFNAKHPQQSGPVGLICQSGGNAVYGIAAAAPKGVLFSKAVSYGNACDLNECDLLEYFAEDPETNVITSYMEGTRNGRRFFKVLRETARKKPVIILKGGQTGVGATTAASHTASLSSPKEVWDALIRQTGAISVDDIDELTDTALPFLYMNPPKGRNTAVVGIGGGAAVLAADVCANAGLSIPPLPTEVRERLQKFTTSAGNIFNNPVDTQSFMIGPKQITQTIEAITSWDGIDLLILHLAHEDNMIEFGMNKVFLESVVEPIKASGKPAAIVLHAVSSARGWQAVFEEQQQCLQAGFPTFISVDRAAKAVSRFIAYHERKDLEIDL